ncbi:MAG: type 4a pilus biogenesis protein PilO [Patescibacteria group bacterium]
MPSIWKKTIITVSIYLAIFVAITIFALKPSIDGLKQNNKKITSSRTELNQIYDKLDYLQKISKNPDDLKSTEKIVNNYWPDNSDISQFIVQTEDLAKSNSLVLDNISINEIKNAQTSSTKKNSSPNGSQFTFNTRTSYSSLLNFIKGMETLARFNSISSIDLNGTEEGTINMRLTGKIYYGK